ncbi:hypothetical protein BGZ92_007269 [Podila epicladia]|nr:hypothetical protein BGZ92_007269 [Podila epicladia]
MDTPTTAFSLLLTSLPTEIVELIFDKLDQPSLAACARSSRAWNELCTPRLWRTVTINSGQRLERFMTNESQEALSRNAGYIRDLTLKYMKVYNIFAPVENRSTSTHITDTRVPQCTNLRRLDLLMYDDPKRKPDGQWEYEERRQLIHKPSNPAIDEAVATLIQRNPGLTDLSIQKRTRFESLLPLIASGLPNLEVLRCADTSRVDHYLAKVVLEHLPESIRSVDIFVHTIYTEGLDIDANAVQARLQGHEPKQHHALESLSIAGYFFSTEDYEFLMPFLERCRNSMSFYVGGNRWFCVPQIRETFSRLGFYLQYLEPDNLVHRADTCDAYIAEYIRLSSRWKTIHLQYCQSVGPLTVAAILDNCDCLESFNLTGCSGVSSTEIRSILGKTKYLKTFAALNRDCTEDANDPFISAADFIALEWGSRSLEEFSCKIEVPPRPNHHAGEEEKKPSRVSDVLAEYQTTQRQVYQKLAKQTSLKELNLGHDCPINPSLNERQFQSQCLEMTLESGLDELFSLRELEMLNVSNMAQRIGVGELEWMNRSWPKLDKLCGMFGPLVDPVPGAREWIRDTKPFWVYDSDLIWFEHHGIARTTAGRIFNEPSAHHE